MPEEKSTVTVRIFGEEYTLKGRGNPAYIRELARYVDEIMTQIKERNPKLATAEVAVLAAINIADLYFASKWEKRGLDTWEEEGEGREGEG